MNASKKNKTKKKPPATIQNFPIVGIGASAGGLDAFKRLLKAIPENSGMAYVLVQHLDPSHESILPEILQRVTNIPVHEITEDIHLAPDHIYIIPSNKILTSTDGVLCLSPRVKKILNLSIDIFFTSLAEVHKEFAIGIVLSGTGSDGTEGLKAIKENGGITIAQDLASAAYDSMPQSAVNAGVVDFIISPENIPTQLLLINDAFKTNKLFNEEKEELPEGDEAIFKQILLLLQERSGVDFTYYKQPTFHRRIARRIAISKKKNLSEYLTFLSANKTEQDELFQDVLIPVTSFFRDPKTFHTLTETVFPALLKNKSSEEAIRIWIAGCSTGEEAYSIAICLHNFLGENSKNFMDQLKIQIFASDISEKSIKKARTAIYSEADVEKLSAIQLKNYFVKNNDRYEVRKFIRDMCVFAPHNFLKDPPFAKMDLITCRNVLIYMDTFLQKKALTTFHYALKENGFLLLGKSETTGLSSELYTQVGKHEKIYSRKSVPGQFMHLAKETTYKKGIQKEDATYETVHADYRKSAEQIMILKSPASVVVNKQLDIVHIHGDIAPFLLTPQGKPTYNLLKMAREGLAFELRNAIYKATKEKTTIIKENIPFKTNTNLPKTSLKDGNSTAEQEKQSFVTLEIIPLTDIIEPHYLIRFEKKTISAAFIENKSSSQKYSASQKQNEQLEKELSQTREDMGSITEDMEAFNEELQSANEELQSSNEEMQSLNEELETSKEELQSTNEELIIVNQELLDKQSQLNTSHLEQEKVHKLKEASEKRFSNILSQSIMAIGILKGKDMVISFANEPLLRTWGKGENIIGKTLLEAIPELKDQGFLELLQQVYTTGIAHYGYEAKVNLNRNGEKETLYYNFVYQPYTEVDNTITGITLLATEVTDQVIAKQRIEESEKRFRILSDTVPHMIWSASANGNKNFFNKYFLDFTGLSFDEMQGNGWHKVIYPEDLEKELNGWNLSIEKGENFKSEKRIRRHDGTYHWVLSLSIAQRDKEENIIGWIGTNTEIEEQKKFTENLEDKVKERTAELRGRNDFIETLIDSSIDSIIVFDKELRYLSLNKIALQTFAKHFKKGVIGKKMEEVIPQVHETGVYANALLALKGNIISQKEQKSFFKDKYYDIDFIPLKNTIEIYGIMAVIREVTQSVLDTLAIKKANSELENRKNLVETILETSKEYIAVYAKDFKLLTINKATEVLMGKKREEVIGKTLLELMPHSGNSKEEADLKSALEGNNIRNEPYQSQITGRYIENYIYPLRDSEDKVYAAVAIAYDVTNSILRQKELETSQGILQVQNQTLELAESIARFGSYSWNVANGKMTYSDSMFRLLDCKPNEFVPSFEKFLSFIHPDDLLEVLNNEKETTKTGKLVETPYRIISKTGQIKYFRSSGKYSGKGANVSLIGTVQDISKDIFSSKELEAKNRNLENANAELASFSYVASHDLQEPLRKIQGFSKRIIDKDGDKLSDTTKDYFKRINGAAERMQHLIESLLSFSSLGMNELVFEKTDLNQTLNEVIIVLNDLITHKNVIIESENLPTLNAVSIQMQQLFLNLISNSIKYAKPSVAPYIKITSEQITNYKEEGKERRNGNFWKIEFSDNGIGFEQQYEHKIFEVFQRLHGKTEYGGTGVGLAICKKILHTHNGTIRAKSKLGAGATFTLYFPID